ncbi:hypothetical protein EHQ68_08710 [Leptospira congkakensis]|uniref:Phytanoyl-CoA dioxygenase n=1 Tax=Leptospira congkakensis TaxID=2484932 RepID=A0A4Z1AAT5_9LEPT|nr:hypothetical protein [Leptospira congkakensis]TGL88710.1 hypothetical protein EHQ69_14780 [Leptospira congkakensis]TGL89296.1 hypothetical protein EHQ68_08710 [Leptospira congkakensis]TGL97264.1 hypothetical protein EHQ70_08205 [Leptospira congkakensis]
MLLESLFAGETFSGKFPKHSFPFLNTIKQYINEEFSEGDPIVVSSAIPYLDLVERMKQIRTRVYENSALKVSLFPLFESFGMDPNDIYVDLFRLRCVPSGFHNAVGSESVLYIHRDSWYANPENQINVWIPITLVKPGAGFILYPSYFQKAIPNNSNLFDYHHWMETGGFQTTTHSRLAEKVFPRPDLIPEDPNRFSVFGDFGEYFLFSSHHLHGTEENNQGFSRFSLEIRLVLGEAIRNHLGPKNTDNCSTGSTLYDMKNLITGEILPNEVIQSYANASALK